MRLPAWATQKLGPIPVWGWGALALGGGIGYVLYKRRSSSSSPTLSGASGGIPSQLGGGSDGGGAGGIPGGGFPPGDQPPPFQQQPQLPQQMQQPATQQQYAPAVSISPSLLGGGYLASQSQLSNPLGSADRSALQSYQLTGFHSYTPSLTDYATEQPGGIQTVQAGLPGTQPDQGLTYSIYGTNTGTGAVVPASQRIAGERYDASGRVIL